MTNQTKLDVDSMDYLTTVSMELASKCNLQCRMCSHPTSQRKPHVMGFDDFKRVMDRLKDTKIKRLSLNMGEPFMNKSIFRMISFAKEKGFFVYISTNGLLLTEESIRKVLETGVDALKFSIEGYAPGVYQQVRTGGNFNRLFRNVVRLKELRDRQNSKLYTWISTILMKGNENLVEFIKYWGPYCDEIEYTGIGNHVGLVDNREISLSPQWHHRKSCPQIKPYKELNVLSNGDVEICCVDFHARCVLGNLLEQDFDEIWFSDKMKEIRQKAYSDDTKELDPCRYCSLADYSAILRDDLRLQAGFIHDTVKKKQWSALEDIQWVKGGAGAACISCKKNTDISYAGFCWPCLQKNFGERK